MLGKAVTALALVAALAEGCEDARSRPSPEKISHAAGKVEVGVKIRAGQWELKEMQLRGPLDSCEWYVEDPVTDKRSPSFKQEGGGTVKAARIKLRKGKLFYSSGCGTWKWAND